LFWNKMNMQKTYWNNTQNFFYKLYSFFPIRLLIDYLQYNRLLLSVWLLPFLFVTNLLGQKFGIPALFTVPEYMGKVDVFSFLFVGLAAGSFIMAFHISSYVVMAHKYPFIIRFSKPFLTYSLNNSGIPFIFIITYFYSSSLLQKRYEMIPFKDIVINLLFFLLGIILFVYFSFAFFYFMNRIVPKWSQKIKFLRKIQLFKQFTYRDAQKKILESPIDDQDPTKVKFYLAKFTKIKRTGYFTHYNKELFAKVFQYQHLNALLYVLFILGLIIIRGLIKNSPAYILPAGASFFVLFTVILLIISMFYLLFRTWTVLIVITLITIYAYTLPFKNVLNYNNSAYGMDYTKKISLDFTKHGDFHKDSLNTIHILNNWKNKNKNSNPKMIIISTSGGGLKMAVWTNLVLSYLDSITQGEFFNHVTLITGASGGMIGAAYFRENYLRYLQHGENYWTRQKTQLLAQDILNPIFYSFSMSDWFFRLQRFKYNHHYYFVDRAYELEQTLMNNIGPIFDKPIKVYKEPEAEAKIPLMFITPTIENNGARMIISATPVSYMLKSTINSKIKNIEFRYTYRSFDADDLRFSTALRMNATFPYVSPDVALPGTPRLYLIDAGLNDNFGIYSAYDFIIEFKDWILKNTSGVILLTMSEEQKIKYKNMNNPIQNILRPVGAFFGDWENLQKITQQTQLNTLHLLLKDKFITVPLQFSDSTHKVALSWHLSKLEKQILYKSLKSLKTKENIQKIIHLIGINKSYQGKRQ